MPSPLVVTVSLPRVLGSADNTFARAVGDGFRTVGHLKGCLKISAPALSGSDFHIFANGELSGMWGFEREKTDDEALIPGSELVLVIASFKSDGKETDLLIHLPAIIEFSSPKICFYLSLQTNPPEKSWNNWPKPQPDTPGLLIAGQFVKLRKPLYGWPVGFEYGGKYVKADEKGIIIFAHIPLEMSEISIWAREITGSEVGNDFKFTNNTDPKSRFFRISKLNPEWEAAQENAAQEANHAGQTVSEMIEGIFGGVLSLLPDTRGVRRKVKDALVGFVATAREYGPTFLNERKTFVEDGLRVAGVPPFLTGIVFKVLVIVCEKLPRLKEPAPADGGEAAAGDGAVAAVGGAVVGGGESAESAGMSYLNWARVAVNGALSIGSIQKEGKGLFLSLTTVCSVSVELLSLLADVLQIEDAAKWDALRAKAMVLSNNVGDVKSRWATMDVEVFTLISDLRTQGRATQQERTEFKNSILELMVNLQRYAKVFAHIAHLHNDELKLLIPKLKHIVFVSGREVISELEKVVTHDPKERSHDEISELISGLANELADERMESGSLLSLLHSTLFNLEQEKKLPGYRMQGVDVGAQLPAPPDALTEAYFSSQARIREICEFLVKVRAAEWAIELILELVRLYAEIVPLLCTAGKTFKEMLEQVCAIFSPDDCALQDLDYEVLAKILTALKKPEFCSIRFFLGKFLFPENPSIRGIGADLAVFRRDQRAPAAASFNATLDMKIRDMEELTRLGLQLSHIVPKEFGSVDGRRRKAINVAQGVFGIVLSTGTLSILGAALTRLAGAGTSTTLDQCALTTLDQSAITGAQMVLPLAVPFALVSSVAAAAATFTFRAINSTVNSDRIYLSTPIFVLGSSSAAAVCGLLVGLIAETGPTWVEVASTSAVTCLGATFVWRCFAGLRGSFGVANKKIDEIKKAAKNLASQR